MDKTITPTAYRALYCILVDMAKRDIEKLLREVSVQPGIELAINLKLTVSPDVTQLLGYYDAAIFNPQAIHGAPEFTLDGSYGPGNDGTGPGSESDLADCHPPLGLEARGEPRVETLRFTNQAGREKDR